MKYKNIPSMLHNFAHSFVSLMNYVEGHYIIDILYALLGNAPERELMIAFPSGRITPPSNYPTALLRSIEYSSQWLPMHMRSHRIDVGTVRDIRMVFSMTLTGLRCVIEAFDDRGKRYTVRVTPAI